MGMAVREPVGSDSGGLETPHDLVRDVSAPGIEVGGRLVLEGDYLGVHCPPPSAVSAASPALVRGRLLRTDRRLRSLGVLASAALVALVHS